MEVGNEVEINGVLYVRKNVKVEKTLSCQKEWKERCKLRAEGRKLYAEGDKLHAEGSKLWAEGKKLYTEGDKLYAEGDKLHAESSKLYAEGGLIFINAVIKTFGNIKLEWKNWHDDKHSHECHLDNGEVYIPV
jgi:hypothetical protein